MAEHDGAVLRALRQAEGLSLRKLATKVRVHYGQLANVELGRRTLTLEVAIACDRALRTSVLRMLVLTRGDDMRRRALIAHLTLGAGALATPAALADVVRVGLANSADREPTDWDQVVADYNTRLVTDPSKTYGASLQADLMQVQDQIDRGRPSLDLYRAGAGLSQLYGLWLGNRGSLPEAHQWYDLSIALAGTSRDTAVQTWALGRSAARGVYERYTIAQTLAVAEQALTLTAKPTRGAVEAHVARATAYGLTGDLSAARQAVAAMRTVVDQLPDAVPGEPGGTVERPPFLDAFVECRIGDLASAERACAEALPALAGRPMWLAETKMYLARARVAAGDVREGLAYAVDVASNLPHSVRVIGVAIRDVLDVVPVNMRALEEAAVLRGYAPTGQMPWEGLR